MGSENGGPVKARVSAVQVPLKINLATASVFKPVFAAVFVLGGHGGSVQPNVFRDKFNNCPATGEPVPRSESATEADSGKVGEAAFPTVRMNI